MKFKDPRMALYNTTCDFPLMNDGSLEHAP